MGGAVGETNVIIEDTLGEDSVDSGQRWERVLVNFREFKTAGREHLDNLIGGSESVTIFHSSKCPQNSAVGNSEAAEKTSGIRALHDHDAVRSEELRNSADDVLGRVHMREQAEANYQVK